MDKKSLDATWDRLVVAVRDYCQQRNCNYLDAQIKFDKNCRGTPNTIFNFNLYNLDGGELVVVDKCFYIIEEKLEEYEIDEFITRWIELTNVKSTNKKGKSC